MSDFNAKDFEIADSELDTVNGGYQLYGDIFEKKEDVVYRFEIGRVVEIVRGIAFGHVFTKQCTIIDRKIDAAEKGNGYCAWYKVSCSSNTYNNKWYPELDFEGGFNDYSTYNDL